MNTFETSVKQFNPQEGIHLRDVTDDDLPVFFENQRDPDANYMAAFTARDPEDRETFDKHWARLRTDPAVIVRTIHCDGQVAGSVAKYEMEGKPEVCYWVGREHWGRGVATRALSMFLKEVTLRPIYAGAAKDNLASLRVLEKCGFAVCAESRAFSNARGVEVEEVFLRLD